MTDSLQTASSNGAGADIDAAETSEWLEAVDAVVEHDGPDRARQILARAVQRAELRGSGPIASITTPYVNTIPVAREAKLPGDPAIERRLRSIIRWNAMAMVVRANKVSSELGGHIASFQSLATLYEVGFNHFWHAALGSTTAEISSTSRATPRPATTPARTWRAGSPRSSSTASARRSLGRAASAPIRTRG